MSFACTDTIPPRRRDNPSSGAGRPAYSGLQAAAARSRFKPRTLSTTASRTAEKPRTRRCYLREKGNGKIAVDTAKIRAEERLDGKYLLSTSDDSLSAGDVAIGYKQLLQVERAFRTLKTTLDLRPVHHRKEDRIRSHVLLCWLALLLVRVAERETGATWDTIRAKMERMHLGVFFGKDGEVLQRTELTQDQHNLLKKLNIQPPPLFRKIVSTPENL